MQEQEVQGNLLQDVLEWTWRVQEETGLPYAQDELMKAHDRLALHFGIVPEDLITGPA